MCWTDAALRLPAPDRGVIAAQLLATLSPDSDESSEESLSTELERRSAEAATTRQQP
jgi:hypothetical protein